MQFKLRNAPSAFQITMDVALSEVTWQLALVYLDDIAVLFPSAAENINLVKHMLARLRDVEVTLKLNKCYFSNETIEYLEYVIKETQWEIASHTTDSITGLRRLQGMLPNWHLSLAFVSYWDGL